MDAMLIPDLLASTMRVSTPLIFCALAGLLSERSGVVDIGLEGKMLAGAFAAGAAGAAWGSLGLALLAAVMVGMVLSWTHGLACVSFSGDQVVSGVAINIIAAGLTMVLGIAWFAQGGQTPPVSDAVRIKVLWPGLSEWVSQWPLIGPYLGHVLLGHVMLVYLAYALVPCVWWLLWRTRFGLRLRAAGENPHMVEIGRAQV